MGATPRKSPCGTCPYREAVPAGVWHPEEYDKLPEYDKDTGEQPPAPFMCHQGDGNVCSGWLGYKDPWDLLAVRLGVLSGALDLSCAEYATSVRLFASGAAAAAHGMSGVEAPSPAAQAAMQKIETKRAQSAGRNGETK